MALVAGASSALLFNGQGKADPSDRVLSAHTSAGKLVVEPTPTPSDTPTPSATPTPSNTPQAPAQQAPAPTQAPIQQTLTTPTPTATPGPTHYALYYYEVPASASCPQSTYYTVYWSDSQPTTETVAPAGVPDRGSRGYEICQ